jgi:hypothetical protein
VEEGIPKDKDDLEQMKKRHEMEKRANGFIGQILTDCRDNKGLYLTWISQQERRRIVLNR